MGEIYHSCLICHKSQSVSLVGNSGERKRYDMVCASCRKKHPKKAAAYDKREAKKREKRERMLAETREVTPASFWTYVFFSFLVPFAFAVCSLILTVGHNQEWMWDLQENTSGTVGWIICLLTTLPVCAKDVRAAVKLNKRPVSVVFTGVVTAIVRVLSVLLIFSFFEANAFAKLILGSGFYDGLSQETLRSFLFIAMCFRFSLVGSFIYNVALNDYRFTKPETK